MERVVDGPKPWIDPRHDFPLPPEVREVYREHLESGASNEHWPKEQPLPTEVRFEHPASTDTVIADASEVAEYKLDRLLDHLARIDVHKVKSLKIDELELVISSARLKTLGFGTGTLSCALAELMIGAESINTGNVASAAAVIVSMCGGIYSATQLLLNGSRVNVYAKELWARRANAA
jgi:hypothetical protein